MIDASPAVRGRGLKRLLALGDDPDLKVARRARAWIETPLSRAHHAPGHVARRARAWIETIPPRH